MASLFRIFGLTKLVFIWIFLFILEVPYEVKVFTGDKSGAGTGKF